MLVTILKVVVKMVSTGSDAKWCEVMRGSFSAGGATLLCAALYIGNIWIIVAVSLSEILYEDTDDGCMKTEALLL
jgi:hypothetical protein